MQGIYKQNLTKVRSRQRVKPAAVQPVVMPTHKVVYMKNKIKIAAFSNTSSEIIIKKWDFKKYFFQVIK